MSKTLPQAIIDGKGGGVSRIILVRVIPESGDLWTEFDWATREITVTAWEGGNDKTFLGGVLAENAFDPIRHSVDVSDSGKVATISGLKMRIANPQYDGSSRFDQAIDTYNFENRTVEIWLCLPGDTDPDYSELLLCYRGVVVDLEYDFATMTFSIENATTKRHKVIPAATVDPNTYPYAPDYNRNKVIPLLYGQLCGGSLQIGTQVAVPIILTEPGKGKYIASGNNMCELTSVHLYLYHQETDLFEDVTTSPGVAFPITYGRPTVIQLVGASAAELRGLYYGRAREQGSKTAGVWAIDIEDMIDRDQTTGVLLDSLSTAVFVRIPIPDGVGELGLEAANNFTFNVLFGNIGSGVTGTLKYYNAQWDNGAGGYSTGGMSFDNGDADSLVSYDFGLDKSAHGSLDDQSDQYHNWTADEIAAYEWGLTFSIPAFPIPQNLVIKDVFIKLNNLVLRSNAYFAIRATSSDPGARKAERRRMPKGQKMDVLQTDALCAHLQGERFGSWINSRSTGYAWEDNLIDGGIWHIEAILRSELGLGDDEINTDSFDSLSQDNGVREDWAFGTVIQNQLLSLDHIEIFCQNAGIIYLSDYQQKEKVVALSKATSEVKTIDRTTIKEKDVVKIEKTSLDDLYNEFEIVFARHWVSGSYRQTRYCNAGDHNLSDNSRDGTPNTYSGLCADSQAKYGMSRKFTFIANWLTAETEYANTSERLIKWFMEWLCYRKCIVTIKAAGLDHVDLEIGDQVKIDHTLLPEALNNSAHFMVFHTEHDLNNDRMKFKLVQIPDLLP